MHSNILKLVSVTLSSVAVINAHGDIKRTIIDGVEYERGSSFNFYNHLTPPEPMASWFVARQGGHTSQDPIDLKDFDTADAICGRKAIPGELTANHTAGTQVIDHWRQWPDNHDGFFWYHMAYCGGVACSDVDPSSLEWTTVKFQDFIPGRKQDDGDRFTASNLLHETLTSSVVTPKCLKDGEWVLKATANSMTNGKAVSEIYPQCINLNIRGGGNMVPPGIPGRELFAKDHLGLQLRLWNDTMMDEYAAGNFGKAGGPLFTCPDDSDIAPETPSAAAEAVPSPTSQPAIDKGPLAGGDEDGSAPVKACRARLGKRGRRYSQS